MKRMHPIVNAIYFLFIIIFAMMVNHPVLMAVMLVCASFCVINSKGIKSSIKYLKFIIPLAVITAVINPMFSHEGITVLAVFPNGNLLTLESISFGLGMAVKLMAVFIWFIYINDVMTSDKIMYLIGAFAPYISNTFSMLLRFIPRLHAHIKEVWGVRNIANKNLKKKGGKLREGVKVLSSSITWVLDDSINTANSMRNRGYAAQKRVAYSIYRFSKKDLEWIIILVAIFGTLFTLNGFKVFYWQFYPYIKSGGSSVYFYVGTVLLVMVGLLPVLDRTERAERQNAVLGKAE